MRPRNAGLKTLSRPGLIVSTIFCGRRGRLRVGAHLHHRVRLGVRRQEDDGVLEVDLAPLAVLQLPLVEDLVEELQDVGVRLLDLVEQDDGVGLAPHGLGEDAPLAVADVARRGALQRRDGVRFLELGHVDRDHVPLAAVEGVGEGDGGLGLADAGRPDEQEDADRLARVGEAGAARSGSSARSPRGRGPGRRPARRGACSRFRTVSISSACILPTGMPVQPAMTSATACALTSACIIGVSPWTASSSALSASISAREHLEARRSPRRRRRPRACRGPP